MKKVCLILAVFMIGLSAQAQNVRKDSRTGEWYAYIDSVEYGGVYNCWLTRMALKVNDFNPEGASYHFTVQFPYVVDSNTTNYFNSNIQGDVTLPLTSINGPIIPAYLKLWHYAADSAKMKGVFGVHVSFDDER